MFSKFVLFFGCMWLCSSQEIFNGPPPPVPGLIPAGFLVIRGPAQVVRLSPANDEASPRAFLILPRQPVMEQSPLQQLHRNSFSPPSMQSAQVPQLQRIIFGPPLLQSTMQPVQAPSNQPFQSPSMQPFQGPSVQPLQGPSNQPLQAPFMQPVQVVSSQPVRVPFMQPILTPSLRQPLQVPTSQQSLDAMLQPSLPRMVFPMPPPGFPFRTPMNPQEPISTSAIRREEPVTPTPEPFQPFQLAQRLLGSLFNAPADPSDAEVKEELKGEPETSSEEEDAATSDSQEDEEPLQEPEAEDGFFSRLAKLFENLPAEEISTTSTTTTEALTSTTVGTTTPTTTTTTTAPTTTTTDADDTDDIDDMRPPEPVGTILHLILHKVFRFSDPLHPDGSVDDDLNFDDGILTNEI